MITGFQEMAGAAGISFSLVFDVSGSMSGARLATAKAAATQFLANATSADRGNLVQFASYDEVQLVLASNWVWTDRDGNGVNDLTEAINGLTTLGATALYDGTALGIQSLSQEPSPKAVIMFSDGGANNDRVHTINSVITLARNEGVPIYTIALGSGADTNIMTTLASQTGGSYHYAPSAADMDAVYAAIASEVRSGYQIRYRTHNPALDGTLRTVTVTATGTSGTGAYRVNSPPTLKLDGATQALSTVSQPPGVAITIRGTVADLDAQPLGQALAGTLYYGTNAGATFLQTGLTLTPTSNGLYAFSVQIPASAVRYPGLFYYLRVSDGVQETFMPANYQTGPLPISVLENHAPVITHTAIHRAPVGQGLTVVADVTETDFGDCVAAVALHYRVHNPLQNTPYYGVALVNGGGSSYSGLIPANAVTEAGVDYYLSAWDSHGIRADCGTAAAPISVRVATCRLTGTPGLVDVGTSTVVLAVSDGLTETIQSFTITTTEGLLAVLSQPRVNPASGRFEFTVASQPGAKLELCATTNLLNWTVLGQYTNTSGSLSLEDAEDHPRRFYRVRQLP